MDIYLKYIGFTITSLEHIILMSYSADCKCLKKYVNNVYSECCISRKPN